MNNNHLPLIVSLGEKISTHLQLVSNAKDKAEMKQSLSLANMYTMQLNDVLQEDFQPIYMLSDEQRDVIVRFHKDAILEHWKVLVRPSNIPAVIDSVDPTIRFSEYTVYLHDPFKACIESCNKHGMPELGEIIELLDAHYDHVCDEKTQNPYSYTHHRRRLWEDFRDLVVERYGMKMINVPYLGAPS
jgi:hypothetical protein